MIHSLTVNSMLLIAMSIGVYHLLLILLISHLATIKTDSKTVNEVIDYRVKLRVKNLQDNSINDIFN